MLSWHVARARKHVHALRFERVLSQLPRSSRSLSLLFAALVLCSCTLLLLPRLTPHISVLRSSLRLHVRSSYSRYSSNYSSASLQLSLPGSDPDRPPTLRRHYEDALTLHADHSSVFKPLPYEGWRWEAVSQQPEVWHDSDMAQRVRQQGTALSSASSSDVYRAAILQSLLEYQFHPDTAVCSTNTRYLLYSFSSEFSSVNTACMSSHTLASLRKPAHVAANKVSSVREIVEQMEKAAQRRKEKNLPPPLESSTIEELADDCKLSVLLDVVRALFVAQASRRELILLPVAEGICERAATDVGAELSSAQWMGCVWRDLFVRPSACEWANVSKLVDEFGYHEDPFYDLSASDDAAAPPSTPVAVYRSVQHCHNDDGVWQHMQDALQPFLRYIDPAASHSHVSRLLLFQMLTRFVLTPSELLQKHIASTQQQLTTSSPSSQPFLSYYAHRRAAKEAVATNASAELPLVSSLLSRHTAASGVRDVLMWLEGDFPTAEFMPQLQSRLPHLRLYHLSASPATDVLSGYIAAVSKLFLVARSGGGKLVGYSSVVGRLLRQLEDDDAADGGYFAGGVVDTDGDEWFDDCELFSWHFYREHTTDLDVQRPEVGINALIYPALAASTVTTAHSASTHLPPVQLLIVIGVSHKELDPISAMFDALSCDGNGTRPFTRHAELMTLLQRMFNSPQTVDEYIAVRTQFQRELQSEVQRLRSAPQPSSSAGSVHSPVIRVDFVPWNVNRPFRAVLKADVAMLARFIQSLATFVPLELRVLVATREPANVIYAGTKSALKELPSEMDAGWRYFFVGRVLRDHLTALSGELRALHASVFHVLDMDDIVIRTAHHTKQLAAFLSRPHCAQPMFHFLRQQPSPLVSITQADLPDLSAAEAAGAFDITSHLRYHGLFERAPSATYTMDTLTAHSSYGEAIATAEGKAILTAEEWTSDGAISRTVDEGLVLHVAGLALASQLNNSLMSVPPQSAADAAASTDPVSSALTLLQAPAAKTCSSRRFLIFDLFLRSVPCSCSSADADSAPTQPLDDPPIAEAIRAVGRTLSLAVSSGRTLIVPQMSADGAGPSTSSPLSYLSYLSSALQPLTACTLESAQLQLSCHCPSQTWHIKPLGGASAPAVLDAVYGPSSVAVGHASDFHFGWLLHYNSITPLPPVSAYQYISSLHSFVATSMARNEPILSFLSSYRSSLSSSPSFQPLAPTLAISLPRSDLYTVRTYVGLIMRQLDVYGLSQLYLSASCSLLYQHQHEDTRTGSQPPSCDELTATVRAVSEQLQAAHSQHKHFHPSSKKQLSIRLSPRLGLNKQSSAVEWVHATLADMWLVAHSSRIVSTHASEEGLLIAELAYEQLTHNRRKNGRAAFLPAVYDLFGHTWLDGMQGSTNQHILAHAQSAHPTRATTSPAPTTSSTDNTYTVSAVPLPPFSAHPPSIRKTVYSSALRFVFIAGIEGAGHHFIESSLGGTHTYSPWNPKGHANVSRVKVTDAGVTRYEDVLPVDDDVLGDRGKIDGEERSASASPGLVSNPHYRLDVPLSRLVYELFVHDSVEAYIATRKKLLLALRTLVTRHAEAPQLPAGVPYHPKRQPVLYPLNHLGAAFGMHSYPNMFGADKMMHHPYLAVLAGVMEEAGADLRVVLTVRSPQACHWSAVRRHHGEEIGVQAAYMFQARGLHDNLAYLDGDMRGLDPAFVLQMHLSDVTRDPFRYAAQIASHVGADQHAVQTSLLQLSHSFAVQPDNAWQSALSASQLVAMRDNFDSSPLLSIFKHRYDSLKADNWPDKPHVCRAPHTLKRFPRHRGRNGSWAANGRGVTVVSIEGSGDWMLRWLVEQLTGYMTGSVHGEATASSKSDNVPRVITSRVGRWSEEGEVLLVSERKCAFECSARDEAEPGSSTQLNHPPVSEYQPVQWATRLAPKYQNERDKAQEAENDRKNRERLRLIEIMEGPDAPAKYPMPPPTARQPKALPDADSTPAAAAQSNASVEYAGHDTNDLIVLYRHPVDALINLASLVLSNHELYSEASRVTLNPIWSRWWKNGLTTQAKSLLTSLMQPFGRQYAHFLRSFPYQGVGTASGQRVLYLRYEDIFVKTEETIERLLDFLRVSSVSSAMRACVLERVRAIQVGAKVSVCESGCGVASDGLDDTSLDAVSRGHARGLRPVSGLVEESTATYPFKWVDLVQEEVWSDFVSALLHSGDWAMGERLAALQYRQQLQDMEEYVQSDPSWTWKKQHKLQQQHV